MSRSREAEMRQFDKGQAHAPFPQELPNLRRKRFRSDPGRLTLAKMSAQAARCGSYGDPVLERRRPGGSDLAIIGQGSQAYLSLSPRCDGVSRLKARHLGSLQ
jgi:hypothetical protein